MNDNLHDQGQSEASAGEDQAKKPFTEPKLRFIEPELVKHGDATKLTKQGFFGTFTPEEEGL